MGKAVIFSHVFVIIKRKFNVKTFSTVSDALQVLEKPMKAGPSLGPPLTNRYSRSLLCLPLCSNSPLFAFLPLLLVFLSDSQLNPVNS